MNSLRERFFDLVSRNPGFLAQRGVEEIGLFGSAVRGEEQEGSDLDVLVSFKLGKKSYRNFVAVLDWFEEELDCPVELVTRDSLSPHLAPQILAEVQYAPLPASVS